MEKAADKIIDYIGGKENVSYFSRCMSRLRFEFKDIMKVDLTELKKMREIVCVAKCGEEICFVIKKNLPYLYMAISEKLAERDDITKRKGFLKYIRCYGSILVLSGLLCIVIFLLGIKGVFFVSFFVTAMLAFFAGVTADTLLVLVKYNDDKERSLEMEIISPLKGRILSNDGEGHISICPHTNIAVSPIDGVVEDILNHAFLIRSPAGVGVFVHIGIDTINMEKCFTPYAKRGDLVKRGDAIVEFNAKELTEKGYSLMSYVDILDYDDKWSLSILNGYATGGRAFVKLLEK